MRLTATHKMGIAALIMAGSVFLSRLMGLVRDKVVSWQFGAGAESDVYFAAFVVPDFLNYLLAGGYISITLIPLLSKRFEEDEADGWRFFSAVFWWAALGIAALTAVAWIFAPELARIVGPGFSPEKQARLAHFLRIILPAQVFFLPGACVSALLYIRKQFLAPALTPLIYNGCIIAGDSPDAQLALEKAKAFPGLNGMDLAKEVTTAETYSWTQGSWTLAGDLPEAKAESELPFHVVAYDFGAKRNILRMLVDRGCRLTVVPAKTSAADVLALNPDGIFLSNGPGDPAPCDYAIEAIEKFLETDIPVFGICLGHQLLALASGAKTIKMKFGHHGGNHPVKDIDNNVVMITAQNHGFAVDEATLPANLRVTHKSLFDGTLQGIHRTDKPAFSFQGHPEASPGPHDAAPLFDHFIELIELYRQSAK